MIRLASSSLISSLLFARSRSSWEKNITKLGPPRVFPSQVLCGLSCSQNNQCGAASYDAGLCSRAIVRLSCISYFYFEIDSLAGVHCPGVLPPSARPGGTGGVCEDGESQDMFLSRDLTLWGDRQSDWRARVVLSFSRRPVWSRQPASSSPTPPVSW